MAKIKVENITKVFNKHSRNANKVLKGVSFELPEKGLVAIYGKSGSGKTTLLNIIGGLDKQNGGKIYIDGECTSGKADKIRNAKIGFIFQNYYLERGYTITEILRNQLKIAGFHDEVEIGRRTEEALKLVDMWRYKNKQGNALSGGQQQRVAIARALVKGGDIILADEPTGNLDAENTVKVMDILKEISKTKLVVIVTHEVTLIQKYADSHIKIVDGQLVEDGEITESELAAADYGDSENTENTASLTAFTKSNSKRNGRLFSVKNIFKALKGDGEEKAYSTGNIFKQIFILAMAVVMCFFAFSAFEALNTKIENKSLGEHAIYTNINSYSALRRLDEESYETIDFFDMNMREGSFSYGGLSALSGISVSYTPRAIEQDSTISVEYGAAPEEGEVLVSRGLAEELKNQLRLKELQNDKALSLVTFDNRYRVSGIVAGNDRQIWLNKIDYVNFLGVYDTIGFSDVNALFFKDAYGAVTYTAEIVLYDGELSSDMARVEINRNSLYKMMADSTQADYEVEKTNSQLKRTPYAIQITGSKMYVQGFDITRDVMDTDIRIYVNEDVLKNIFVYISPNLQSFSAEDTKCYFEISAADGVQLASLKTELKERGVTSVNIASLYAQEESEALEQAMGSMYLYLVVVVLLLLIYFFIEKSGSIKNSKEYGIYRAIGVNRSNLLFKETLSAVLNNIVSYFVFFFVTGALVCARYAVMNTAYAGFIGLAAAVFAVSAVLMIGISLIPYLFVLTKTPSQILSRYDI